MNTRILWDTNADTLTRDFTIRSPLLPEQCRQCTGTTDINAGVLADNRLHSVVDTAAMVAELRTLCVDVNAAMARVRMVRRSILALLTKLEKDSNCAAV